MADAIPRSVQAARAKWLHRGVRRPAFAVDPAAGEESVWDYPRPPAVVPDRRRIEVLAGNDPIASTNGAVRVLETSHPPSFYIPPSDIVPGRLVVTSGASLCEWKGRAEYLALTGTVEAIGWRYQAPFSEFAAYAGWVSFYPALVTCLLDGEVVRPQGGGFYGGWITDELVGPFKGDPGTSDW